MGWVAPAVIGGVVGYVIAQPKQQVIVQQPPVVVRPQQVPLYRKDSVYDANCNCYKDVFTQVN